MDERTFQKRFTSLLGGIKDLPAEMQCVLAHCTQISADTEVPSQLVDVTDALRLGMTYLVFDLEATRRENRYLRRLLEDQSRARSDAREHEQNDEGEGESFHDDR